MPITIHPKVGQIVMCDFSAGFKVPEMIKKRPVLVLTPAYKGHNGLVTVTPLSTVKPDPIEAYHYLIPKASMPQLGHFQTDETWLKGDMIYTVGFHRLDLIKLGKRGSDGKREYFTQRLGREQMKAIYECILHGLNLSHLAPHI
jgi:uncharacterized protein YifN (PemK superfamily)